MPAHYPNILRNSLDWFAQPYAFLDAAQTKHGQTFRVALPGMGNVLVTGEPQLIQAIVANKNLVGGKGIQILRALFGGESLMMLQGNTHQQHRRIFTPMFRKPNLQLYDELTVDTTREMIRDLPVDQPFSVFELTRKITQFLIVRFIFGQLPPRQEAEALRLLQTFMTSFHNPLILFLRPLRLDLGPLTPWGRAVRNREQMQAFIREQIRSFRLSAANEHSMLAHILAQPEMSEAEMVAELFALLAFGHDTTSASMAWAFAHIYQHPEAVARIQAEPFGPQDLDVETSFTQACIHESMRLSPIVVQLFRVAEQDVELPGHAIRKDEMVMPCIYLAHHNPQIFAQPECFIPERFMDGSSYLHSFFPYGFGTRLCLGKPLAERQLPLILSTVAKNANLALASGYTPDPVRYMFFVAPRAGALMVRKNKGFLPQSTQSFKRKP